MPIPMQIYGETDSQATCPLTVSEGRQWLSRYCNEKELLRIVSERAKALKKSDTQKQIVRRKNCPFRRKMSGSGMKRTVRMLSGIFPWR